MDNISITIKNYTMLKIIKYYYYSLLITPIKINNKYKYPLLKTHPSKKTSNYHYYRHQIELIKFF